jgi:hypothetical protein
MSAFGGKADMLIALRNVRKIVKAKIVVLGLDSASASQ